MAWLEQNSPNRPFQVGIRYAGKRLKRSTRTKDRRKAEEIALRVERRLKLVEQGELILPSGTDLLSFLLQANQSVSLPTHQIAPITLSELAKDYLDCLPIGALEENTLLTCRIHIDHLKRLLGVRFAIPSLTQQHLQAYVRDRGAE